MNLILAFDTETTGIPDWKIPSEDATQPHMVQLAARKAMGGKQPTLAEAYKHLIGAELQDAHTAMADTKACMDIFFAIRKSAAEAA